VSDPPGTIAPAWTRSARSSPATGPTPSLWPASPGPPASLRLRGRLGRPVARVAIVGTRDADEYGRDMARRLARGLVRAGVSVVSGGARGIDAEAHEGRSRPAATPWRLLASGVDLPTPIGNHDLFERILSAGGALLSEYEDGTASRDFRFVERNRIVSGLSDAVVVVRAGRGSGALITADLARAQRRPLLAVPGEAGHPLSEGPLRLLREGGARWPRSRPTSSAAWGSPRAAAGAAARRGGALGAGAARRAHRHAAAPLRGGQRRRADHRRGAGRAPGARAGRALRAAAGAAVRPAWRLVSSRGAPATLLVVESPAAALTLRRWLGPGWDVRATGGHLLDLPRNREGIDLASGFEPCWELVRGRARTLSELKRRPGGPAGCCSPPIPTGGEGMAWQLAAELGAEGGSPGVARVLLPELSPRPSRRRWPGRWRSTGRGGRRCWRAGWSIASSASG